MRRLPLLVILILACVYIPAAAPATAATLLPTLTVGATTSVNDTVGSGNTCAGFLDERTHLGQLGIRRAE